MNHKTVALYCRVDSDSSLKEQQNALLSQKRRLEEYAKKKNLSITACYEDTGYSGQDDSRPGWIALINEYQEGRFDAVLVVNRSRLHRRSFIVPFHVISLDSLQHQEER